MKLVVCIPLKMKEFVGQRPPAYRDYAPPDQPFCQGWCKAAKEVEEVQPLYRTITLSRFTNSPLTHAGRKNYDQMFK